MPNSSRNVATFYRRMKIIDFLISENQQIEHLTGKDKASALLKSIINELTAMGSIKKPDSQKISSENPKVDYRLELLVTMQLLEYYIDSGNLNLITMPYTDTKEEKERVNTIKTYLDWMLKE